MPEVKFNPTIIEAVQPTSVSVRSKLSSMSPTAKAVMVGAGVVGGATGAYHGYRRHRGSWGWALGWSLLGSIAPFVTVPVSLAQGFGKPKPKG